MFKTPNWHPEQANILFTSLIKMKCYSIIIYVMFLNYSSTIFLNFSQPSANQ